MGHRVAVGVVVAALATAGLARADDFAAAVKDATGEPATALVVTELNTFKLGPKCLAKLPSKAQAAVHTATFVTRDVAAYAKAVTGDDWSSLDNPEPQIAAFKARFGITVAVEGDDCDAGSGSLWLGYWSHLATSLKNYPPPVGKVFITLNVSSKLKDVSSEVSKDGTSFTFNAPKNLEVAEWSDKLERPFRKLSSGLTDDFAFATMEATGMHDSAWVLTKFHTFKLGKTCQAKLADKRLGAVHAATFATRDIIDYAKTASGDDWNGVEGQSANDPKTNLDLVAASMDAFKSRLSIKITVEGDDCDVGLNSRWLGYWTTIATALRDYPPRAKKVAITLNVTAKARDVAVVVGKGGASISITAPRDKEVAGWSDKLTAAFQKLSNKR